MVNHQQPKVLPLHWWIVAAAIALVLVWASHPFIRHLESKRYADPMAMNLKRLEQPVNSRPIIALGSSLTGRAYLFDEEMNQLFRQFGIEQNFIRLSGGGAEIDSFVPILDQIASYQPSLVAVELEMLTVIRTPEHLRSHHKRNHSYPQLVAKTYQVAKSAILSQRPFYSRKLKANYGRLKKCKEGIQAKNYQTESSLPQRNFDVYAEQLAPAWLNFFREIERQGGQIILVELGRSSIAAAALSEPFHQKYAKRLSDLAANAGVSLWHSPNPFELSDYCDLAHLNQSGQTKFSRWFVQQVAKELQ